MAMGDGGTVLILDDDRGFGARVQRTLGEHGHRVVWLESLHALPGEVGTIDAVVVDWPRAERDAHSLLSSLRERVWDVPAILTTAAASAERALEAMRAGAVDLLPKGVDAPRLLSATSNALVQGRMQRELSALRREATRDSAGLLGSSPALRRALHTIESVAATDAPVLIAGEAGTGKERAARTLHARSGRSGRFVALDLKTIPTNLLAPTLFGQTRDGVHHPGACEQASGGTLFLNEIASLPLELQLELLGILEEDRVRSLGGAEVSIDTRVVAATSRSPELAVAAGELLRELYVRLNAVPLRLPPLRERREDVAPLATHALRQAAQRYGKAFRTIAPDALRRLELMPWPGNVRELIDTMERIVIVNSGDTVTLGMLPHVAAHDAAPNAAFSQGVFGMELEEDGTVLTIAELERRAIMNALQISGGNRNDAASLLGISPATVYRKLKAYGVTGRGRRAG